VVGHSHRRETSTSTPSDLHANPQGELDHHRLNFIKTELALCYIFSTIAAQTGNHKSAAKSVANAEKAYETVLHYLLDTEYSKHLTDETIQEFRTALGHLRDRLDGLQPVRK
jgi:hypothetical protein